MPATTVPTDISVPGKQGNFTQSNTGSSRKKNIILILVILFIVLIILVSFFLFKKSSLQSKNSQAGIVNAEKISFPGQGYKDRFVQKLNQVENEHDKNKKYTLLESLFTYLKSFYIYSHDPSTRKELKNLSDFIAVNYPENYNKQKTFYELPCVDRSCGQTNYPPEILKVKESVESLKLDDKFLVNSILKNLEGAATTNDKNLQWSLYKNSLESLIQIYKVTKSQEIKITGENFESFLEKNYPENYKSLKRILPNALKFE